MSTALADALPPVDLRPLPVSPDDGFPQSFLLALGERTYRVELYVNVAEHLLPPAPGPRDEIDVVGATGPVAGPRQGAAALLVVAVSRQQPDGVVVPLLRRRLLPGQVAAHELVLVVDELRVAAGNLNGAGRFGSVVAVRVGVR